MTEFLAGSNSMNFPQAPQLFAGEMPIHTDRAPVTNGLSFAQYEVIALDASGNIIKFNPAGSAPANVAAGILCNAVDSTVVTGQSSAYYTGGCFNHAALVWPAGATHDTFAERKAAFAGLKTIGIAKVI